MEEQPITLDALDGREKPKLTVQLSWFNNLSGLEQFAQEQFEYEHACKITDFDRDQITDDVFRSMKDGRYWTSNRSRDFLVTDALHSELQNEKEATIKFPPHCGLLTVGFSHFDRIPDALAELIDNAIQATNNNSGEREIEVEVRFPKKEAGKKGEANYLVVWDNGRGMDASGLSAFATFHLAQKDRGFVYPGIGSSMSSAKGKAPNARKPTRTISSGHISKFGVGALEAGFYLGSRIQVVTKVANNPDVREFVLDQGTMEERQKNNEEVYISKILLRAAGGEVKDSDPAKELLNQLRGREVGRSQFTYIVLSLRDEHSEILRKRDMGKLPEKLASIYHYYLFPDDRPGRPVRNGAENDGNGGASTSGITEGVKIMFTRTTNGTEERVDLAGVEVESLEKRFNTLKKDSFPFEMEVPHPMKKDAKLRAIGVIHYYPHDGTKETRPRAWVQENDEEDLAEPTIEVFWEGRLVPKSHATAMSFFPSKAMRRLKKDTKAQLCSDWRHRIMGMLFVDWNFPISNNKLNLQFRYGYDLNMTLLSRDSDTQVLYGDRRNMDEEFADWLIKCHKAYDKEHTFDMKINKYSNEQGEAYGLMKIGPDVRIFANFPPKSGTEIKLKPKPNKPLAFGKIMFFREKEDGHGRKEKKFKFQQYPVEVYGNVMKDVDKGKMLLAIDEYDKPATKNEWARAMKAAQKLLPAKLKLSFTNGDPPQEGFNVRIRKPADSTGVKVAILNGNGEEITKTPSGVDLHVHSNLTFKDDEGVEVPAFEKPLVQTKTTQRLYWFTPITVPDVRQYDWTISATLADGKVLATPKHEVFRITGKPGDPIECVVEGAFSKILPLTRNCWVPPFTVKLLDGSGCDCPSETFKSVTLTCAEPGAFEIRRQGGTGGPTDRLPWAPRVATAHSLNYDKHSWELVPRDKGILSDAEYATKTFSFVVAVEAASTETSKRTVTNTFSIAFKPGEPTELVLMSPESRGDGTPVASATSGGSLPPLTYYVKDHWGNRTAPSEKEEWQVDLEVTPADNRDLSVRGPDADIKPSFSEPMKATVAAARAHFENPIVEWNRKLPPDGLKAKIEARFRGREITVSATSIVTIEPTEGPFRMSIVHNGSTWKGLKSFQAGEEIDKLGVNIFNQYGHGVKDENTCESVTCSWDSGWKWTGHLGAGSFQNGLSITLPILKVPTLACVRNACTVTVKTRAVVGRATKFLSETVEYAIVAGRVCQWVAVGHDDGILDNPGPVKMTVGSSSKDCLDSFAQEMAGFRPVDKHNNEVQASRVSDLPSISIEEGASSMETQLMQNSSGPVKLKKPKERGLFKFPDGFNISGKPGQVKLVVTSGRGVSRASEGGDLCLLVDIAAGPPVGMKVRSVGLSQATFVNRMTVKEQAGFEISDLEVKLEDASGNEALLPGGGINVTVTDGGPTETFVTEYNVSAPCETLVLTLPRRERRLSVSFVLRVRGAGLGSVKPAYVTWQRPRSNAVTTVKIEALSPVDPSRLEEGELGGFDHNEEVQRQVDGPLPTLVVWVDTDDGIDYFPPKESITVTLTEKGSDIPITEQYQSPGPASLHAKNNALEFKPQPSSGNGMDLSVGEYIIKCTYVESRRGQPEAEESATMIMHVVAGAPHRLQPHPHRGNIPDSLSASNLGDGAAGENPRDLRDLLPELEMVVLDRKDNINHSGIIGPVRMRVWSTGDVPSGMPKLENSDNNGYLQASCTDTNTFIFPPTSLQAGIGQTGGTYVLEVDSMNDRLEHWTKEFLFTSKQEELQGIQEAAAALKPLKKKYDLYHRAFADALAEKVKALKCAEDAINKLQWDLRRDLTPGDSAQNQKSKDIAMDRLANLRRKREEERKGYNTRPVRATLNAKHKLTPMAKQRIGELLYVAEVGFAESGHDANLLSQAAGSKMKAIYIETMSQFALAREAKACAFCKEAIEPYQVKESGLRPRPRNDQEKKNRTLPNLPTITGVGYMGYLVNRIQLPAHDEHLRDSLFWALYGEMVLFDTHAHAKQSGKIGKLDILIEEDGSVLGKNGYMDVSNIGEQPTVVFDAMPAIYNSGYADRDKEIDDLEGVVEDLHKLNEAISRERSVEEEHEPATWMGDYNRLRENLEELMGRTDPRRSRQRLN